MNLKFLSQNREFYLVLAEKLLKYLPVYAKRITFCAPL